MLPLAAAVLCLQAPGIEVPFELVRNQVIVSVSVGGKGTFSFLLDTGTDPSAFDAARLSEFGIAPGRPMGPIGGGGTEHPRFTEITLPDLNLGGLRLTALRALAGPSIGPLAERIGRPIVGILGRNFFEGRIVEFDYPGRRVRIHPSLPPPRPGLERRVLPLELGEDLSIPVRIQNHPLRAMVDTGASGTLNLTPRAIRILGLESFAAGLPRSEAAGYRGTFSKREGTLPLLQVGGRAFNSLPAGFWDPGTGHDEHPWDLSLGNGFWRAFVLILDLPGRRLILEDPEAPSVP